MNPVVHFEMPYEDRDRMAKFYSSVFGWETQMMGQDMGNYVVVQTDETDNKGMLKKTNRINGGFYQKSPEHGGVSVVISVDDIQAAINKVIASGGKIVGGSKPGIPDNIPGIGLYIGIIDTEGNHIALLQPNNAM